MKKKYYEDEEDFEKDFFEDIEEGFDDTQIFDDFDPEMPDINTNLLYDVFEGDRDLYENYLDG